MDLRAQNRTAVVIFLPGVFQTAFSVQFPWESTCIQPRSYCQGLWTHSQIYLHFSISLDVRFGDKIFIPLLPTSIRYPFFLATDKLWYAVETLTQTNAYLKLLFRHIDHALHLSMSVFVVCITNLMVLCLSMSWHIRIIVFVLGCSILSIYHSFCTPLYFR